MVKRKNAKGRSVAIFYTIGAMPTDEEYNAVETLEKDFNVFIRNGSTMSGNPEPAHMHAGNVPAYFDGEKLPVPDDARGEAKIERHDFLVAKKERQKAEVAAKKGGKAAAPAAPPAK